MLSLKLPTPSAREPHYCAYANGVKFEIVILWSEYCCFYTTKAARHNQMAAAWNLLCYVRPKVLLLSNMDCFFLINPPGPELDKADEGDDSCYDGYG